MKPNEDVRCVVGRAGDGKGRRGGGGGGGIASCPRAFRSQGPPSVLTSEDNDALKELKPLPTFCT